MPDKIFMGICRDDVVVNVFWLSELDDCIKSISFRERRPPNAPAFLAALASISDAITGGASIIVANTQGDCGCFEDRPGSLGQGTLGSD